MCHLESTIKPHKSIKTLHLSQLASKMDEFYQTSLKIHIFCANLLVALIFVHLFLVNFRKNGLKFAIRIRNFLPLYYTTLAFIALSGTNMLSVMHFGLNLPSISMIFAVILLILLGIFEYKLLKKCVKMRNFGNFSKKINCKILLDFCIVMFVSVI